MDEKLFQVKGTFIGGDWHNSNKRYDVINPSTNKKLTDVPISDIKELEIAVDSAKKAQKIWQKTSLIERAKILEKLAKQI